MKLNTTKYLRMDTVTGDGGIRGNKGNKGEEDRGHETEDGGHATIGLCEEKIRFGVFLLPPWIHSFTHCLQ
jgi:hypothetical protein